MFRPLPYSVLLSCCLRRWDQYEENGLFVVSHRWGEIRLAYPMNWGGVFLEPNDADVTATEFGVIQIAPSLIHYCNEFVSHDTSQPASFRDVLKVFGFHQMAGSGFLQNASIRGNITRGYCFSRQIDTMLDSGLRIIRQNRCFV